VIHNLATVLLIAAFIQAVVFVFRYLMTDWFRHTMGRHAMSFMGACALILSVGLLREFAPNLISLDAARVFAFILINLVFGWRNWLLFTGQRRPAPPKDRVS
jgi:hypothetical protein